MMDGTTSPLRRRMIEDMTVRELAPGTQRSYIRAVRDFSLLLARSPDQAEVEDLRRYQLHMRGQGATAATMNAAVSALRFLFSVTLARNDGETGLTAPSKRCLTPFTSVPTNTRWNGSNCIDRFGALKNFGHVR